MDFSAFKTEQKLNVRITLERSFVACYHAYKGYVCWRGSVAIKRTGFLRLVLFRFWDVGSGVLQMPNKRKWGKVEGGARICEPLALSTHEIHGNVDFPSTLHPHFFQKNTFSGK